jgi:hypothetical protein
MSIVSDLLHAGSQTVPLLAIYVYATYTLPLSTREEFPEASCSSQIRLFGHRTLELPMLNRLTYILKRPDFH